MAITAAPTMAVALISRSFPTRMPTSVAVSTNDSEVAERRASAMVARLSSCLRNSRAGTPRHTRNSTRNNGTRAMALGLSTSALTSKRRPLITK